MQSIRTIDRVDTLAQRAYLDLRQAIRGGALQPDQLYSENELGTAMGISRTPVREALIELSREGLVEIIPQRGFRLRTLSPAEITEVFDLRAVLESYVVRRLAEQATASDISKLRGLLERQQATIEEPGEFLIVDEEFHLLMPRLVGLERSHKMLGTLRGGMWLTGTLAMSLHHRAPQVLEEHTAIVDAIEAREPASAGIAMRRHIESTRAATSPDQAAELEPLADDASAVGA